MQPIANVAFMKYFFFALIIAFFFPIFSFGQDYTSWNCPDSLTLSLNKDSLEAEFSKNKEIPEGIEVATLYALSFYPELKNTIIKFKEKRIKTTLNVRTLPACCKPLHFVLQRSQNMYCRILYLKPNNLDSISPTPPSDI